MKFKHFLQVDAECYRYAYDFICQVLQPSCRKGDREDAMVLPCRSFCRDFLTGCGSRLSGHIKEALDCNTFPEYRGDESCLVKPGKCTFSEYWHYKSCII